MDDGGGAFLVFNDCPQIMQESLAAIICTDLKPVHPGLSQQMFQMQLSVK